MFNVPSSKINLSQLKNSKLPLKNKNQNDLNNQINNNSSNKLMKLDKSNQKQPDKLDSKLNNDQPTSASLPPPQSTPQQNRTEKSNQDQQQKTSNPLRLLVGKLVFLDIQNSYKLLNKVKECLNLIEARIADCLSKDVNYVITNREKFSSVSNEQHSLSNNNLSPSSNTPSNTIDTQINDMSKKIKTSPNTLNFLSRSNSLINRTQAILEKASKGNTSTDILTTARRLGINVMNICEIERYVEKYMNKKKSLEAATEDKSNVSIEFDESKNMTSNMSAIKDTFGSNAVDLLSQCLAKKSYDKFSNHKIYKLKSPFLKFEPICKQYKPIYQEFTVWHDISLDVPTTKSTNSPFQIYFSDDNSNSSNCSSTQNNDKIETNQSNNSSQLNLQFKQNTFKSPTSCTNLANATSTTTTSSVSLSRSNSVVNKPTQSTQNSTTKLLLTRNPSFSATTNLQTKLNSTANLALNQTPQVKRKPLGYCECCKQRYDNLKQHLTSAQHENFDRNQANFKEIDEYVNGVLNFKKFLVENNLAAPEKKIENETTQNSTAELEEIKKFAKIFNEQRALLGISQTQIIQALSAELKDPILTESAITRFERLDITPRSGAKMRPVLEKLINNTQLKFGDRLKTNRPSLQTENSNESSKKRKRNGSFSPHALQLLNESFNRNPNPSNTEYALMSNRINYDEDLIRVWFTEKQKNTKSTTSNPSIKKFKKVNLVNSIALSLLEANTSLLDESSTSSMNTSFNSPHKESNNNEININNHKNENENQTNNNNKPTITENSNQTNFTPMKTSTCTEVLKNHLKKTPSLVSSFSLSSPSAAVLFGLNSNSFSIPNDLPFNGPNNTSTHNTSATTNLLASKVDLISGNSEVQTITPLDSKTEYSTTNASKSDNSTDLSCIDDVVLAAFVNDFSYEIVQK